jgi:acetyltransferase-like isoleucine patch superfamily enzyme
MEIGTPMRKQPHRSAPIAIGDDVWISANVTILKGVTIGSGAVIGAGAVVTHDIPPLAIAVGAPARVIRQRS